ncbi:MAG: hypothetical protein ACON4N_08230 [Myxococcota bacterium]
MRLVLRLLVFLLVCFSGICVVIWAGWYNPDLDFVGLARYARRFPLGPAKGPLAACFGSLVFAWILDANTPHPVEARRPYPPMEPPDDA